MEQKQNTPETFVKFLLEQGYTAEQIMEAVSAITVDEHEQQEDRLHDTRIDITERIKSFTDAHNYLGEDNPLVKAYNDISHKERDIIAYTKLRIIAAALNEEPEGWRPNYQNDEGEGGDYRWYPYFRAVAFGGYASYGALAGLAFAHAFNDFTSSIANCGSRLCYKSEKLAEYSGNQFKDIWEEFLMR